MPAPKDFAADEERLLAEWEEHRIFERSIEQRHGAPVFSFYDGPPFANGLPHYGHMLASVLKDVVTRHWTMRGFRVERTFGWDCHGLPVENAVEKELGVRSKREIEALAATPAESVAEFCRRCRSSVFRHQAEWRTFLRRIGRWASEDEYATLDGTYTESVWWAFSELHRKGLVYEDYRVSPYCPRCGTPLSNFEVNQGYRTVTDPALFIKFKLIGNPDGRVIFGQPTYVAAWTTTPWTLPGNVALAVAGEVTYVAGRNGAGEALWFAKGRQEAIRQQDPSVELIPGAELTGDDLAGYRYEPLFDVKPLQNEKSHQLYEADFVTTDDGTGVVHTAVMYGEDDFTLGKRENLPQYHTVNLDGTFTADVPHWAGRFVKDCDAEITADLASRNLLVGQPTTVEHDYPFCYRCESPLLYYALTSWFVAVTKIPGLVAANASASLKDAGGAEHAGIRWVPSHLRDGRFGKWLEGARDWAVSRSRYWGAPLPVWRCQACGKDKVLSDASEVAPFAQGRNVWFGLRHGEAENNVARVLASGAAAERSGLTESGREHVRVATEKLRQQLGELGKTTADVTLIVSPLRRTQESSRIIAEAFGLRPEQVITDERVAEMDTGPFDGRPYDEYERERANGIPVGVERPQSIARRVREAATDWNSRFTGRVLVLISHGDPLWLLGRQAANLKVEESHHNGGSQSPLPEHYPVKGELYRFDVPWLDLHRPYIDELTFTCGCGGKMVRVSEVFDCWFESGSMPYAQYGVKTMQAATDKLLNSGLLPADFIAEGLDQTRGWFYTLHVLSVALFGKPAYKTVVVNGLILARDGKKLSKRLRNYTPPEELFSRWGVDPIRFSMVADTPVGEDYRFSDEAVQTAFRQVVAVLWNVVELYRLYAPAKPTPRPAERGRHVLDTWVLAQLGATVREVTERMDEFDLTRAARPLATLINDLSTWYVRRSRDRIKAGDPAALGTLRHVLLELAKLLAPFTPFLAEQVYRAVGGPKDSVHLEDWPSYAPRQFGRSLPRASGEGAGTPSLGTYERSLPRASGEGVGEPDTLAQMARVRSIAEAVHALRQEAGMKLRQPLAAVALVGLELEPGFRQLLADEVNVAEAVSVASAQELGGGTWLRREAGEHLTVALRTDVTPELQAAGLVREFTRQVNSLRKAKGLTVKDRVKLRVYTEDDQLRAAAQAARDQILATTTSVELQWVEEPVGTAVEVGEGQTTVEVEVE